MEPSPSFLSRGCGVSTHSVHARLKHQLLHSSRVVFTSADRREIFVGKLRELVSCVSALFVAGGSQAARLSGHYVQLSF